MSQKRILVEIRVAEVFDESWFAWFLDMEMVPKIEASYPGTTLVGTLPDQTALFGLLARVRDLNLTLLEVKRTSVD